MSCSPTAAGLSGQALAQCAARHLQSKAIQARERAQIRTVKGGIRRVEVFQMDGVGISIIERPRPLHNHDMPNPAQHLLHPHMRRAGDVPAWVLRRPLSVRGWAISASLRSIGGPPPVPRQYVSPWAGRHQAVSRSSRRSPMGSCRAATWRPRSAGARTRGRRGRRVSRLSPCSFPRSRGRSGRGSRRRTGSTSTPCTRARKRSLGS